MNSQSNFLQVRWLQLLLFLFYPLTSLLYQKTAVDFYCLFLPRQHLIFQHGHKTACGALCKQIKVFDLADATICLFKDRL